VEEKMANRLLEGFRALDLTDRKGFVCGQFLASLGVEVIKIEKSGGDPSRNTPPFIEYLPGPKKSLYWLAFNSDKKSITLNLETGRGRDLFRSLVERSDFVLESFQPGYMDSLGFGYEALSQLNRRIIVTSITHFGQKGPFRNYKGSELVDSAMGGVLENTGYPDRPPVKEALDSVYFHANAAAALGTLMSHYYREISGEGQQVDVSIQEVATSRVTECLVSWEWDKYLVKRNGPMGQHGFRPFRWIWPCRDGYVNYHLMGGPIGAPANQALSRWIDEEGMDNPLKQVTDWLELDMATIPQQTHDDFEEGIGQFFLKHTKKEISEQVLKRGINAVVINDPIDILDSPQLKAREYWETLKYPGSDLSISFPRHFFLSNTTENYTVCPAPDIGQDNEEIFGRELGLSATELASLKEENII
jgi:crotonobetainyl-CoA:carnitine CoA-transferase CaiB-like acyl-CoA transferase